MSVLCKASRITTSSTMSTGLVFDLISNVLIWSDEKIKKNLTKPNTALMIIHWSNWS